MMTLIVRMVSRPPRARGLKQSDFFTDKFGGVAPPAGAWIETMLVDMLPVE